MALTAILTVALTGCGAYKAPVALGRVDLGFGNTEMVRVSFPAVDGESPEFLAFQLRVQEVLLATRSGFIDHTDSGSIETSVYLLGTDADHLLELLMSVADLAPAAPDIAYLYDSETDTSPEVVALESTS